MCAKNGNLELHIAQFPFPSNSAAIEGSKYLVLTVELITRFVEKYVKFGLMLDYGVPRTRLSLGVKILRYPLNRSLGGTQNLS